MNSFYNQCLTATLRISAERGFTHIGSSLSAMNMLAPLFEKFFPFDNFDGSGTNRSALILSKGHAAPALYGCLVAVGAYTERDVTDTSDGYSIFEDHPTMAIDSVVVATGSLGHGLGVACGIAEGDQLCAKRIVEGERTTRPVFVVMGDGELNEGSVWEAAMYAPRRLLNNIVAFVDFNGWQATARSTDLYSSLQVYLAWEHFGWRVVFTEDFSLGAEIGYNIDSLLDDLERGLDQPLLIIVSGKKGRGISFMEDDNNWHYRKLTTEDLHSALSELATNA